MNLQGWSPKLSDGWAKYKEKVPDSNQNVEATSSSERRFTELKDLFIKGVQKNLSKMNYVIMYSSAPNCRAWIE